MSESMKSLAFAAILWGFCVVGCIGILAAATDIIAFDFLRTKQAQRAMTPVTVVYVAKAVR